MFDIYLSGRVISFVALIYCYTFVPSFIYCYTFMPSFVHCHILYSTEPFQCNILFNALIFLLILIYLIRLI